ncbi:MAG: CehA/McbA family metallohydrolase [Planctomycetota bacterium]
MLDHPYADLTGGRWLRGNLHTHTNRVDGSRPPQAVLDDYAARGYGFLMISDHDICTGPTEYAPWDSRGLILIGGNEISADGPHLLHVGADRRIAPHPQRQQIINDALAARGFIIVNHPNWQERFDHCPLAAMQEWDGYLGLEIYNGTIGRLHGSPYATNKWDLLLGAGRRLWGFANDDSHLPADDVGLGWNAAYVTDPTPAGVVDALRAGRFYASTGVEITAIEVDGTRIRVTTRNARRIVALREIGRRFAVADDNAIEVDVPDDALYVRFECWGDGEQFAWTQPFWAEQA